MDQALGMHAPADASFVEQVNGALLEHTGTAAAEHVSRALALDDDVVDGGLVQKRPQQQAGKPGANDRDLRSLRCRHHTQVSASLPQAA